LSPPQLRRWLAHVVRLDEGLVRELAALAGGLPRVAWRIVEEAVATEVLVAGGDGVLHLRDGAELPWPDEGRAVERLDQALASLSGPERRTVEAASLLPDPSDLERVGQLGAVRLPMVLLLSDPEVTLALRRRLLREGLARGAAERLVSAGAREPQVLLWADRLDEAVEAALAHPEDDEALVAGWAAAERGGGTPASRADLAHAFTQQHYSRGTHDSAAWWTERVVDHDGEHTPRVLVHRLNHAVASEANPLPFARELAEVSDTPAHRRMVSKAWTSCMRLRDAFDALTTRPEADLLLHVQWLSHRSRLLVMLGRFDEGLALAEEAVAKAAPLPAITRAFRFLSRAEPNAVLGRHELARADVASANAGFAEAGNPHGERNGMFQLAMIGLYAGDIAGARATFERCAELTAALGLGRWEIEHLNVLLLLHEGRPARALASSEALLRRLAPWIAAPMVATAQVAALEALARPTDDAEALARHHLAISGVPRRYIELHLVGWPTALADIPLLPP